MEPLKVFISYTHKDEKYKKNLVTHLNSLIRQKYITLWYDNLIMPGDDLNEEIRAAMEESQIFLLMVSADYLESYYCFDVEVETIMKLYKSGRAAVIPVVVRPVDLKGTPFENLKSLPTDRKAVSTFSNQDTAYEDIVKGIRMVVDSYIKKMMSPSDGMAGSSASPENVQSKTVGQSVIHDHRNYGIQFNGNTCIYNNHMGTGRVDE